MSSSLTIISSSVFEIYNGDHPNYWCGSAFAAVNMYGAEMKRRRNRIFKMLGVVCSSKGSKSGTQVGSEIITLIKRRGSLPSTTSGLPS